MEPASQPGHRGRSLVSLLAQVESQGIPAALDTRPGLPAALCRLLALEGPFEKGIYDRFLTSYWEGIGFLAGRSPELQGVLRKTMPLSVNLEATDAPLYGHFRIRNGRIDGGPEMVPFKIQDVRFFGPVRLLMMFLNNELPLGYSNLSLQSEGHPGLGRMLFPLMAHIARLAGGFGEVGTDP